MAQEEVREVFNRKGKVDESGIREMNYLDLVIKETLRLHPPAALLLPRECGERCVIDGYEIPVKSKVIVNAWAIGRDPNYWNEPESFNPGRFLDSSIDYKGTNFEYIPFGAGRRMCPGISYGLANIELPLALLLYHFDWKLPNGMKHEYLDMTEDFGVTVCRKEDLHLIPILYHPPPTVKTQVSVNAWAIGRDPNYWTDPESFYPERFLDSSIDYKGTNFESIPLGAGRRICPGISYGLANIELPLALLLYHFDWELPNGMKHEALDMSEASGVTICRKEDLQLIPIPYHPPVY